MTRIEEAISVITTLGLPRAQQNERSALTLLSLLNIGPDGSWSDAEAPLMGITPMMTFFKERYGKDYAPNTRETVRRQTVHQFLDAGLVVANPDKPDRAVNSPKAVYQISQPALSALRTYGTPAWDESVKDYLTLAPTLASQYAAARDMERIPITLPDGATLDLSPGGQNVLIEQIVTGFCERFTPGGKVIYVGDADAKWVLNDTASFAALGVSVDQHGKMPDLIVHDEKRGWLVLVEAVTSHGPVDGKRHEELRKLFAGSKAGLVYVTAFLTRAAMKQYLSDISWETEVWCADAPSHLIHINGTRIHGPNEQ